MGQCNTGHATHQRLNGVIRSMTDNQRILALWLFTCCTAIFVMVVLGGVTRLTGSGLSMVEWEPLMGILPPLNQGEWQETFRLYQQYPEYQLKNYGMTLDEFRGIFWFEYAHRVLGRVIGVVFFLPLVYFIATRRVGRDLVLRLLGMFVLGGLQGLMGWYMVKSGLVRDPHVSQYRLTAHLGLAFIIYAYMFWVALGLFFSGEARSRRLDLAALRPFAAVVSFLVFLTALSGGFVAGLQAGLVYNSFPTMNGQWIPDGLTQLEPFWRNFFENATLVQFDHRVMATLLFLLIPALSFAVLRRDPPPRLRLGVYLLLLMLGIQVTLGVSTLLLQVPIPLAAAHQGGALLLFTLTLFVTRQIWDFGRVTEVSPAARPLAAG